MFSLSLNDDSNTDSKLNITDGKKSIYQTNKSVYSMGELTKPYKKQKNTRVQKRLLEMKMMLMANYFEMR